MSKMRIQLGICFMLVLWVDRCDAWWFSWTDTTTLAPAVDRDGSGNPAGSGEQPPENIAGVGAEIIDVANGIREFVQTWDQTTEAPRLTTVRPTSRPKNERVSKKGAAGISSHRDQPGNGTTSLEGMGSGGSDHLRFSGEESWPGSAIRSELGSQFASGSGPWSSAGFGSESESGSVSESGLVSGSGVESSTGAGFKSHLSESQQGALMSTDLTGLIESHDSILAETNMPKLDLQESALPIYNRTDEGHAMGINLDSQKDNSLNFSLEKPSSNRKINSSFIWNANDFNLTEYSGEYTVPGDLLTPFPGNHSLINTEALTDNQVERTVNLPVSHSPVSQELLPSQTLLTSQAPSASQALSSETLLASQIPIISQSLPTSQTAVASQPPIKNQTPVASPAVVLESPRCLILDTTLSFCSSMGVESFTVPNYLNQSSVEEIQALLNEWAWLLSSNCHHSLEWFFCLLLVPKCGPPGLPPVWPCRSFCEVLRDGCWSLLDEGHLPVECHTLPDEEDDGYQCFSVSNKKGNHWLEWIPALEFIFNQYPKFPPPSVSGFVTQYLDICPSQHKVSVLLTPCSGSLHGKMIMEINQHGSSFCCSQLQKEVCKKLTKKQLTSMIPAATA